MSKSIVIKVAAGQRTTALVYPAKIARLAPVLILGHGAGASQTSPFMVSIATHLAARGLRVVTFNFLYTERGRKFPDRPDVLEATWRAVLQDVRARWTKAPIFIGGKSMGGRIASQIAADPAVGRTLRGLVFLGYPLHPPGKPEQLRTQHLPQITAPMLFVQGSKDPFGTEEELAPLVKSLPGAELFVIAGGDHSFEVPKKGGISEAEVFVSLEDAVVRFVGTHRRQEN